MYDVNKIFQNIHMYPFERQPPQLLAFEFTSKAKKKKKKKKIKHFNFKN